jgi:hypothetical protein|tara:strand:- start:262 stop:474 length:213 start_codon:yes stop_codon:yes gene_type:complete
MNVQKLQETKQHLILEKEKQLANLYEISGAIKLLDQQILQLQESEKNNQPETKTTNLNSQIPNSLKSWGQ